MPKKKPQYRSVCVSLSSIVKHPETLALIESTVCTLAPLTKHAYQALALYTYHLYQQGQVPEVTEDLVRNLLRVLCDMTQGTYGVQKGKPMKEENRVQSDALYDFLQKNYRWCMDKEEVLTYTDLTQALGYIATEIVTAYTNNVTGRYYDHLTRFVRTVLGVRQLTRAELKALTPEQREARKDLSTSIKTNVGALLAGTWEALDPRVGEHRTNIISSTPTSLERWKKPWEYLAYMFYMATHVKDLGGVPLETCPRRRKGIPSYVRIDTNILAKTCLKEPAKYGGTRTSCAYYQEIKETQGEVWSLLFKTHLPCFSLSKDLAPQEHNTPSQGRAYTFAYQISTDGVGCSILHIRNDLVGLKRKPKEKPEDEVYVDDPSLLGSLCSRGVVGVDPGNSDLMYCAKHTLEDVPPAHKDRKNKVFRYSRAQRKAESKSKKYEKLHASLRTTPVYEGFSVAFIETTLSTHSPTPVRPEEFQLYCAWKNKAVDKITTPFYTSGSFRRDKWRLKVNRRRADDQMARRFRTKLGSPDEVVVGFGDWSTDTSLKGWVPSPKGGAIRKVLRRHGYDVALVHEAYTSKRCHHEARHNKVSDLHHPIALPEVCSDGVTRSRPVHGLLKCKTCECFWNRDVNGALNIALLAWLALTGRPRPSVFTRLPSSEN